MATALGKFFHLCNPSSFSPTTFCFNRKSVIRSNSINGTTRRWKQSNTKLGLPKVGSKNMVSIIHRQLSSFPVVKSNTFSYKGLVYIKCFSLSYRDQSNIFSCMMFVYVLVGSFIVTCRRKEACFDSLAVFPKLVYSSSMMQAHDSEDNHVFTATQMLLSDKEDWSSLDLRRTYRAGVVFIHLALRYKLLQVEHYVRLLYLTQSNNAKNSILRLPQSEQQSDRRELLQDAMQVYSAKLQALHAKGAQKVLELCKTNGGIFVKVGQHAASLRPALPECYISALSVLQDQAQPTSFAEIQTTLRKEWMTTASGGTTTHSLIITDDSSHTSTSNAKTKQQEMETLLSSLAPQPLGTASLAQVHKARLQSGEMVAIKVQHPKVAQYISGDLRMLHGLNTIAEYLFANFSLGWAIDELRVNLCEELDFRQEAHNATRMRELVAQDSFLRDKVWVPAIFPEWSTPRVLVMELVENGIPIRDLPKYKNQGLLVSKHEARESTTILDLAHIRHVVLDLFVPPGVTKETHAPGTRSLAHASHKQGRVALLDHGLYRCLSPSFRELNCTLWKGMALQDELVITQACKGLVSQLADAHLLLCTSNITQNPTWLLHNMFLLIHTAQKAFFTSSTSTLITVPSPPNIEQLVKFFPVLLLNRPLHATAELGQSLTLEEKGQARRDVSQLMNDAENRVNAMGQFATQLPRDMVFLLRAMHLIKDLNEEILLGSRRERLLHFTRLAVQGEKKDANWISRWYNLVDFQVRFTWYTARRWITSKLCYSSFFSTPTSSKLSSQVSRKEHFSLSSEI